MPSPHQVVEAIANQMMKGPKSCKYAPGTTPESRSEFLEKHRLLIEEIAPLLPRGSAAVGAVVCKCALMYGKDKAVAFTNALRNAEFQSKNDPVYLLWSYLQERRKNDPIERTYRMAVTACRAYCAGKQTLYKLREAKSDVFEWETPRVAACLDIDSNSAD